MIITITAIIALILASPLAATAGTLTASALVTTFVEQFGVTITVKQAEKVLAYFKKKSKDT